MAGHRGEKDEKSDEKQREKGPQEKTAEEKWVRDPLGVIVWAAVLIWIGIAFLIENLRSVTGYAWVDTGAVIFIGIGFILLIEVAVRLLAPQYRRPVGGTVILAFVFLAIGLGGITNNWAIIGPVALIGIGIFVLFRGFLGRRRRP
jgi:hypothetical protein